VPDIRFAIADGIVPAEGSVANGSSIFAIMMASSVERLEKSESEFQA
jgi:hypothetical protein